MGARGEQEKRAVVALMIFGAAARLGVGAFLGPSVDESYAIVMGRQLRLSYYDHPPLMFWLSGLAVRLAGSESPWVARLPFVVLFMGTTWLTFRLGLFLFGERPGLWAALTLNLALFFTLPAAGCVLPDGPLLYWSVSAVLCLAHATAMPATQRQAGWWLGFGASCGLALLSKYHAVFLLGGAALYLASSPTQRRWLKRPEPYAAVAVAAIIFMPVIVWNATHAWASLRFQASRALPIDENEGTPFVDMALGQAAWMLPWIWLPLVVSLVAALRRGPRDSRGWLLVCLAIGPIGLFTLVAALGTRGLPHWQAPGYFMLLPLLGRDLAERVAAGQAWVRRWAWGCVVGLALVLGLIVGQTQGRLLERFTRQPIVRDPTDDLVSWQPVVHQLAQWGYPRANVATAGATWADAAKLAYALGPHEPVCAVGPDPRGFEFVTPQASLVGSDVLLVARRRPGPEAMVAYAPFFGRIRALGTIDVLTNGRKVVAVSVYLGERLLRPVPPRRGR